MHQERYAIVGYGFRMPGGIYTADDFWRLLSERGFVREPVADRYGRGFEPVAGESGPGRFGSGYEGLMRGDEPYLFDCRLFGMSVREAAVMDPQMRMLLTCTWEAFEQAGWDQARLRNSRTGVFVGAQMPAAAVWQPLLGPNEFTMTGTSPDMLANRISYAFNLMGPSAVQMTACSSAGSAMHAAVAAIGRGDCHQAVVGSATFLGSAGISAGFGRLGVCSPDGGCRSFDATANGYMRAEGVFVYLVKPLAAAEAAGDRILAVIAGTAINTAGAADGAAGTGPGRMITAPTQHAQAALMREACARAGLLPREVDYVEAHATGTRVGDRIEGNAIGQVFGGPDREVPLRIASVKSNVGHMEAAAFGCALLKVLLMFERRTYAPVSRHFMVPNPDIDFTGLRVQTETEPFGAGPAVIGINSFGFGGANAHCLLTEYRPGPSTAYAAPAAPDAACMVPLSARSPGALRATARALATLVAAPGTTPPSAGMPELDLYTLAGNLSTRRTHFATRTAFAATGLSDLAAQLDAFAGGEGAGGEGGDGEGAGIAVAQAAVPLATLAEGKEEPRVLMVFAGQGTQWAGCARELYASEPVFRAAVDEVDAAWREHAGFSLRDESFGAPQERLDEVQLAQPAIFMTQVALTELLRSWGVRPACVAGHSAGEVAAAHAAGIYSLADATRLIFHRAEQQQRTAGSGRMLAIGLDAAGTREILSDLAAAAPSLEIACENAPASTVACGSAADVAVAVELLEQRGISRRLLRGNVAFHSCAMDPIEADLRACLAFLDSLPLKSAVPFISSVTGEVTETLDAAYWWSNVRRPVRFAAAIATAARDFRPDVVLEVSPHPALLPLVRQCLDGPAAPAYVPTLAREADSRMSFCRALGALYREGVSLDFAGRYPRVRPVSHLLPPHPKDQRRLMDPLADEKQFLRGGEYSAGPLVGRRLSAGQPRFEVRMSAADFPWLADHRVQHTPIMPAAGYVEMILQALGGAPAHFEVVEFRKPCLLGKEPVRLQTELTEQPGDGDEYAFQIRSQPYAADGDRDDAARSVLHCTGRVRRLPAEPVAPGLADLGLSRFVAGPLRSREAFYGHMDGVIGDYFQYGPRFQVVRQVRHDLESREYLLDIGLDDELWRDGRRAGYLFPPALLDGGLQAFLCYLMECSDVSAVPRRFEGLTIGRLPDSARLACHAAAPGAAPHDMGQPSMPLGEQAGGSMTLYDAATGARIAHLERYVSVQANPRLDVASRSRYVVGWQPKFVAGGVLDGDRAMDPCEPGALIGALQALGTLQTQGEATGRERGVTAGGTPRMCRVAEFTQNADPEDIALADYLSRQGDGTSELWLLGASGSQVRRLSEAFGRYSRAVRVAAADLSDPAAVDLGHGLLRVASCELVIADARTTELTADAWAVLRRLLVPGGLALIRHAGPQGVTAGDGWSRLAAGEQDALWAAPPDLSASESGQPGASGQEPEGLRWLIAGAGRLADLSAGWMMPAAAQVAMSTLDSPWPWSRQAQEEMRELHAIDFFCDEPGDELGGEPGVDPLGEQLVARFLEFLRALLAAREGLACAPCRVTVVTRQGAMDVSAPRMATMWGAVRALTHELGFGLRLDLRLVDIAGPQDLPTLRWLACHDVRERELAVRDGRLYAPRLLRLPGPDATVRASAGHPYHLQATSPGQLTGLTMRTRDLEPPGPGQVEVDVAATALNFRDVMVALDLLPLASYERSSLGRQLGMEASGTVSRTGAGVTNFRPGDPVVVMTGGCVASQVTVDQRWVYPKPGRLSMAQAAALPTVYVTAYHALADLARLRAGQRVLIHSAMGGVGQAALGIARHLGAEVYATAGTAAKRERLRERGVAAVFDSRSYRWHEELMAATSGEGVDVVLNSLAGHHIALCLRALRPGGWHCEIGKVDIYADAALGMSAFRKNLRFAAIDVDRLKHDDPVRTAELAQAALRLVADGAVPPPPVTEFGFGEYENALRLMASGQHEGKVVLMAPSARGTAGSGSPEGTAGAADFTVIDRRPFLDPEAAYLVTGGLGGVGLRLVAYLAWAGARHLVLLDRDPARRRDAAWVRQASGIAHFLPHAGVQIDVVPADVARLADVKRAVAGLTRPLRGVFHLAAILDDHPLADVSPESVAHVFAPKASGAWNLHLATEGATLDHFVLMSSVASVVGNAGQSVYAAANAYVDGLAAYRKSRGLPGLAYNMAAVTETGMAARNPHMLRLVRAMGLPPISAAQAIAHLDYALRAMPDQAHLVGAEITALHGTADDPDYLRTGRWTAGDAAVADEGLAALSVGVVMGELCRQITVLSGNEQVGPQDTIASFGVNSVSIAELSAFIRTRFNHHVGILELMTTATPESVASAIVAGRTAHPAGHDLGAGSGGGAGPGLSAQARPGPAADASLPDQCRADLELLQQAIRDLVSDSGGEPVPADRWTAVFLTGATGFVGRFVLAELLRQAPSLAVHCLVRADSAAHGMDRIREALQAAEIWDEDFAGRISAWPGDVREPRLGLPESDFARLAGDADAVYHLAADLSLISSYAAVREANTRSVKNVLELALSRRRKHVVYASTMGVFPQYFCNFGADFAGLAIADGAAPDIGLMKSVLPPGLVGYPWSKLVVEQALEYGRALGLPVAVMRLPQMGVAAATGYTQSTDIKIRLVMAVADAGVAPTGFRPHYSEPVDTASEAMVRISLNPERRHSIYHLVNPVPYDHGLALTEFGLDVREVSYPEFRRTCKARGTRNPLHGYWPLVDHFADAWFPAVPAPTRPPVAVTAVEEDCRAAAAVAVGPPAWPGLITTAGRSLGWVLRHPARWPYPRPSVSLDTAALLRQSAWYADHYQVPFEDAYPAELVCGLDRLVAALRSPAARIRADRHPAINFEFARKLRNRASLAAELLSHPEIAEEPVHRPVFILGINRTGTTLLHRLLARTGGFWAPYPEEVTHPALPAGQLRGARRAYAEDLLTASGIKAAARGMHAVDLTEPEEEFAVLEESFAAWTYLMRYRVPGYARWLGSSDPGGAGDRPARFAYQVHRQAMRHFSWQRGTRLGAARRPWLLKMPFHLAELATLARAYPDAAFIQTHRSPLEFMPSWLGLSESLRALSADGQDKAELGAEQLEFMSRMLTGAAQLRASDPDLDRRFFDVSYLDLVAAPVTLASRICQHFGWTFDDQARERMGQWHARQAARRETERRHRYSLAEYGLAEGQVADAFAGYTESALASKVRMQ